MNWHYNILNRRLTFIAERCALFYKTEQEKNSLDWANNVDRLTDKHSPLKSDSVRRIADFEENPHTWRMSSRTEHQPVLYVTIVLFCLLKPSLSDVSFYKFCECDKQENSDKLSHFANVEVSTTVMKATCCFQLSINILWVYTYTQGLLWYQ